MSTNTSTATTAHTGDLQVELPAGWRLAPHALLRRADRDVSIAQIVRALVRPVMREPACCGRTRLWADGVELVVDFTEMVVITVVANSALQFSSYGMPAAENRHRDLNGPGHLPYQAGKEEDMATSTGSNQPGIGDRVGVAGNGTGQSGTKVTPAWSPVTIVVHTPSSKK